MATSGKIGGKGKIRAGQGSMRVAPDEGEPGYPTLLNIQSGNYEACAQDGKPVHYTWTEQEPTEAFDVTCLE